MNKENIVNKLKELKPVYQNEGLEIVGLFGSFAKDTANDRSDIDILYDIDAKKFYKNNLGFKSFLRIKEIKEELQNIFKTNVDLCAKSGLSNTGEKYILGSVIYV
jgi:predicted nucleotidyltransferase